MKKQLSLLVVAALPLAGFSQRVVFDYDAAGNRISRSLEMSYLQAPQKKAEDLLLFRASPYPAYDDLLIEYIGETVFAGKFNYCIQNMSGETFISGISQRVDYRVNISGLTSGLYILMITYQNNDHSMKIIKK